MKQALIDDYRAGHITRSQFIKRMIGLGLSMVAAGAFAQALAQDAEGLTLDGGKGGGASATVNAQQTSVQRSNTNGRRKRCRRRRVR